MNVASVNKRVVHDGKIVKSIMCFACGKAGNIATSCPDKKKQASTSKLIYEKRQVNLVKVQVL